mgnify:CR=1 FL=1
MDQSAQLGAGVYLFGVALRVFRQLRTAARPGAAAAYSGEFGQRRRSAAEIAGAGRRAGDTTASPGTTGTTSTQAPSSTSETFSTKSPDSTSDAVSTKTPDSNLDEVSTSSPVTPTPTTSPSATIKPTTSPTAVPISTPGNSHYTGNDSLSDYATPTRTVYDTFHYLHCGYCLQKSYINHQRNRNIKHYLYKRWQWCIGLW